MSVCIRDKDIDQFIDYNTLVRCLRDAFSSDKYEVPTRSHLDLPFQNTALIMPAWNAKYYGLKQILVCPNNPHKELATITGKYDLYDVETGQHLAEIDARKLTAVRTAATSVLASSFFVLKPKKLVMLGNGVIAHHLADAYNAYYNLQETVFWSRSVSSKIDIEKELRNADIISCATHAYAPILLGKWIVGKPHIDLVGSYKPNMREADDALIGKSDIYIDDWNATQESGDLTIPLENQIIRKEDIKATLFELSRSRFLPQKSKNPTVFKSVGHAIEDLATAVFLYEKSQKI